MAAVNAFVDTTIVADALLKPGSALSSAAHAALRRYKRTELPVYAIRELKAGPIANMVWFHNKLVITGSYHKSIEALQRSSLTPRRYLTATALDALRASAYRTRTMTLTDLVRRYGENAKADAVDRDRCRLALRTLIAKAWLRRRQVTSDVVLPIPCYREVAPFEERGLLVIEPKACEPRPECSLAARLKERPEDLQRLRDAVDRGPSTPENKRRSKALRRLVRKPKTPMTFDDCRDLGDAFFAFFCPPDAAILTTNQRDHAPLAAALGKTVEIP